MEKVTVDAEASFTETFHDCNSQPTSPRPADKENKPSVSNGESPVIRNALSVKDQPAPAVIEGNTSTNGVDVKQSAQEKKLKKKEDKNMEFVLKALSSLSTTEEKLAALCKKYTDLLDENRQNYSSLKTTKKSLIQVSRERDGLQTENSKLILAKSKLETLCRELQRHNKTVKDESLARQREEEERRKEITGRFQDTITDVQAQMEAYTKRNDKLTEDNRELTGKLHTLLDQYEKREEYIQNLIKQKDLEGKLLEAKLAQCQKIVEAEAARSCEEKKGLLEQLIESKKTQEVMSQTEMQLKAQLQVYTEKYAEFETTLNRSNDVFNHFKTEMEGMNKKMRKLEKEAQTYKSRFENTNLALVKMVEQKEQYEKIIDMQGKKCEKLESLCRALQGRASSSPSTTAKPDGSQAEDKSENTTHSANQTSNQLTTEDKQEAVEMSQTTTQNSAKEQTLSSATSDGVESSLNSTEPDIEAKTEDTTNENSDATPQKN